jgi:hypothetical protein
VRSRSRSAPASFADAVQGCVHVVGDVLGVCDPVPIGDPSVQQLVANGSFEYPNLVTWFTPAIAFVNPTLARCGKMSMTLPGGSGANAQTISQSLSIPGMVTHIYLDFWLFEPRAPSDFLTVQIGTRLVADVVGGVSSAKWLHIGLIDIDVTGLSGRSVPLTGSGGSVSGQGPSIDDVW